MDQLTAAGIAAALGDTQNRLTLQVEQCVTSTNLLMRQAAAAGAPEGCVILAGSQTAGRGRLGRSFYSPQNTGLYMSLLLRPALTAEKAVLLTAAAAVAVYEAIDALTGEQAQIKWVNDIFLHGRKICGILTEAAFVPGGTDLDWAVVGIGINVYAPDSGFPPELANIAGALCPAPQPGLRDKLAGEILRRFWQYYTALPVKDFLQIYRKNSMVTGRDIVLQAAGKPDMPARALAIDDDCRLLVEYPDGTTGAVSTGEISLRMTE